MTGKKGFTLIELLVVVAIIGILAAVGVVAYNGITAIAKNNVIRQNHANVFRYLTLEIAKCELGQKIILDNKVNCNDIKTYNVLILNVVGYSIGKRSPPVKGVLDFINPHNEKKALMTGSGDVCGESVVSVHGWGNTYLELRFLGNPSGYSFDKKQTKDQIEIITCVQSGELLFNKIELN